jgi:hypothetical protein
MAQFRCVRCNAVYEDYYPPDDTCTKCCKGHIRITTIQGDKTMTAIKPTIKLYTSQEDDNTGIHINSLILEHNGNNYQFHGGSNDTIHVFTESIALYVLTVNESNGTMGLNAFMAPEPDVINGIYLHNPQDIKKTLGDKWEQLSPKTITMKLIDYLM